MWLVLVVLLIALGGGAYYYTQVAPTVAQPTPVVAEVGPAPTAKPGETSVRITEAELTQQLNSQVAGKPLGDTPLGEATVREVRVALQGGQVQTTGSVQVGGVSAPMEVRGTVQASNGRPVVAISDAKVGGIALPIGPREQLERALQDRVDALVRERNITVSSVTVGNGAITLVGRGG